MLAGVACTGGSALSTADFSTLSLGSHRFKHSCKANSNSKPLHVDVSADGALWTCFRCGEKGSLRHAKDRSRQPIRTESQHATLSDFGRELWSKCRQIDGIALEYLRARRCVIPPGDGDLRWHPDLKHSPSGHRGPALVGLVSEAATNAPITLHRTWIQADGRKAPFDPPRLLLQGHKKAGGVIRLWPDEAVTVGLGIAEGIETGLAAAHAYTPLWSCIDAGNMAAFPVLNGIETLVIFADHDDAGLKAANACATRWASHAEVLIIKPEKPGADIADVAAA
jgi:putative DNA primase/helicase